MAWNLKKRRIILSIPKPNGYRSLHIVVSVPVHLSGGTSRVPVEIQIRTIAMDFGASLEHDLRYKSKTPITRAIAQELKDCADDISALDTKMQSIYHQLEAANGDEKEKEGHPPSEA